LFNSLTLACSKVKVDELPRDRPHGLYVNPVIIILPTWDHIHQSSDDTVGADISCGMLPSFWWRRWEGVSRFLHHIKALTWLWQGRLAAELTYW